MRPFKFFFTVSLGIILFLFLAKFIVMAIFVAAIFSIFYHGFKKLQWFFHQKDRWHHEVEDGYYEYVPSVGSRKPIFDGEERYPEWLNNHRTIVIQ